MHAANAKKSKRLQATLKALRGAPEGLTTRQLSKRTGTMACHSDVSECRANGYNIRCDYEGTTAEGRRIYRYKLVRGKR